MRPLRALGIYIGCIFLGGALIAPWFPKLATSPFHRYLDRSFLIAALVGIWPLMRALGTVSLAELGIVPPYEQMRKLFGGLSMGLISLSVVAVLEIVTGHRPLSQTLTAAHLVKVFISALLTAVAIGTLEEVLFRGAIFGWLRHVLQWPVALVISSMIFAVFHFLARADIPGPVTWDSGFILLPRLFDFHGFIPGFLSLTLIGAILAYAYQATGNLYFSVGLHIGWIMVLKIYLGVTTQSAAATTSFWGTERTWDGWLTFLALVVTLAVFKLLRLEKREPYTIR